LGCIWAWAITGSAISAALAANSSFFMVVVIPDIAGSSALKFWPDRR
jgi:hypothetical protein